MKKLILAFSLALLLLVGVTKVNAQIAVIRPPTPVYTIQAQAVIPNGLSIGSQGNAVTLLQQILIAKGYLPVTAPTGYFGNLTSQAVAAFQAANNLPRIGKIGPQTTSLLNQLLNGGIVQQMLPQYRASTKQQPLPENRCASTSGYSATTGEPCSSITYSGNGSLSFPVGCSSTSGYSSTTGLPCNSSIFQQGCISGSGYSPVTGLPCNDSTQVSYFPPGCNSAAGNSATTGEPCNPSTPVFPLGCNSASGYSSTTGLPCNGTTQSIPSSCTNTPSITITSPTPGAIYTVGQTVNITWQP